MVTSYCYLLHTVLNDNKDGITNVHFTLEEIQNALTFININESSAVENIRANVMIDAFNIVINRTLHLFNMSIYYSVFPTKWKTSIVVPLPKVNNPKFAADMRPISRIPLPGKILEHLIGARLKVFIQNHETLSNTAPNTMICGAVYTKRVRKKQHLNLY